ncbi:tRNA (N(6)-L-threonylcarbamoyladenosine(37)-C(2))-methylthiotransferase MtaB [Nitratiruptor tergarcus]|uniref:MiaB-like tRNA modifying enzyme n=1 Tax=Nitratiruptor tergarcus DSM 16512 TaxID=1069081 RepID=A0A1W1WU71_9BACT|nr:tRNA (N(6)-L-threonylcarbamoyladenosine(37)-C(2))-methylthiotransferase MtaB [Nitratiruptor tergarcus]SMC09861.1 MiaB-like tRNA modifying enzyme [Nitratiruptor tergarcus DSM 16512]
MKVYFKTFGCRTNLFDTQVMMSSLRDFTLTQNEEDADIVVVNSCTVTNGADGSVRNYINRLNRSGKKIYLTGCGAFTKGEDLFKTKKVIGVFGHSEKTKINELLKKEHFFVLGDLESVDKAIVSEFVGKSRAFIKIQEGCDFRCSYCIIPYVRGNARSMDEELILEQIRLLAANGFGEFIFTGTNVGSYGKDSGSSLAKLLKRVSLIRGVRRVRVGSIEPVQIDEEFKEILDEPWMAKHLHIALQHTSDRMLEFMNRRNRVAEDLPLFEEIASHGYAIGTDFIVGHPGESEEIFKEAVENIKKFPLTHIHLFTYSKRDGTPAATMKEPVRGDVAKGRYKVIKEIIEEKNRDFRMKKLPLQVLIESKKGDYYFGHDQFFNPVFVQSELDLEGNWIELYDYEVKKEGNFAKF